MKRIVVAVALSCMVAGPALAADLPPPQAPAPQAPATYVPIAVPVYSWTGVYIGANVGYGFGTVSPSPSGAVNFNADGFLAGGTLGANYQMGSFVVGIEGDFDYNSLDATIPAADFGGTAKSTWLATIRGRAGWAWDRVLFYGTAGGAFAPASATLALIPASGSTTMTGWTAGAGVEAALTPNWTARIEYLYVDYPSPSISGISFSFTENVVRAGIDYKFGW